ncbi:hypothetical protein GCM10009779_16990 [Polymorphospora rubra]|uniref:Transposase n=1 Tax=Polymorphospora rubra TaxID=338584 RepID=A0A810N9K1_9ACTN|nr:hypothetical protein Prubr_50660 [Polymorphospora rubra]
MPSLLDGIRVPAPAGRPRTRPDAVAADRAYSSRANRAHLRRRRITAVIPEKTDQQASRKRKGVGRRTARSLRPAALQEAHHRRTLLPEGAGLPGVCRQDVADPVANCLVCCAAHWAAAAATGIVGSTNHAASRP